MVWMRVNNRVFSVFYVFLEFRLEYYYLLRIARANAKGLWKESWKRRNKAEGEDSRVKTHLN